MSSSTPQRAAKVQYPTINLLDNDIAKLFTHLHPVILLSIYFVSFKFLVQDPVSTLTSLLLPLVVLQVAYVILCLPPTGSSTAPGQKSSGSKGSAGKKSSKPKAELPLGHRIVPAVISLLLSISLGTPLFLGLVILFGAPMTTHLPHTVLLAAHVSLLTALPLVYTRGVDTTTWRAVSGLLLPIDETFGAALGTILGAWIGAVPIPLDWDREWQKWPVTIITGAYIGWAVGKTLGGSLLKGKVVDLRA